MEANFFMRKYLCCLAQKVENTGLNERSLQKSCENGEDR